jgi:hypothetical protein
MPGTKIETAINQVAEAVKESNPAEAANAVGMMGIKGAVFQTIANTSAMALLGVVMWVQFRENAANAKYDREMFRDELKALRVSQEVRWEKTDATHGRSMEKMWATVERAVAALETAVKEVQKTNVIRATGSPP